MQDFVNKYAAVLRAFRCFAGGLFSALGNSSGKSVFNQGKRRAGIGLLVLSLVLTPSLLALLGSVSQSPRSAHAATSDGTGDLGQPLWNGVSSWLFGTNDTEEYDDNSILNDPNNVIVPDLAKAHFGLVRSFFFHFTDYGDTNDHRTTIGTEPQNTSAFSPKEYADPAPTDTQLPGDFYEIERRIDVIEQIGATCLGVLPNITTDPSTPSDGVADHYYVDPVTGKPETDLQFDEEVVAYLGNRCNLYEFGNEPDNSGMKALNPNAKFIGGVLADNQGLSPCQYPAGKLEQCFMTEMLEDIASGKMTPVPDAISFHWYPCEDVDASTESLCLDPNGDGAFSYGDAANQVRDWMQQILGHTIPLGISEWNADPGSNPYMDNASFMTQFTADSMQSMINAKLDFAAEFDAQSGSGYSYLDMFDLDNNNQPKAQYTEMATVISQYYGGEPPPSLPTLLPGSPGPGAGTPGGTATPKNQGGTPVPGKSGTPLSTPGNLSISMAGDTTPSPSPGIGDSDPNPRTSLFVPNSPDKLLLDILFILGILVIGSGLAFVFTTFRKLRRRKKKLATTRVARKKTA
jgi:hypothetical protein